MRKLKSVALDVALALGSLSLCLVVIELFMRHALPVEMISNQPRFLYRHHPQAGFTLSYDFHSSDAVSFPDKKSHWVATNTNEFGFRSRSDVPKVNDTLRVMALGDSFTFGFGVRDDETFPWKLDELLSAAVPGADVLNAGITGASNRQQIAYFWSEGVEYEPDLVLLQIFVGNDLKQNWDDRDSLHWTARYGLVQDWRRIPSDGIVRIAHDDTEIRILPGALQGWDETLYQHFRLYRFATDRLLHLGTVVSALEGLGLVRRAGFEQGKNLVQQESSQEGIVEDTCDLVDAFRHQLEAKGMRLLVLPIPARVPEVGPVEEQLHACLTDRNVPHIAPSLYPTADRHYYMRANAALGHFTEEESEVIAAALYRSICRDLLDLDEAESERVLDQVLELASPLTSSRSITVLGEENDRLYEALRREDLLDPGLIESIEFSEQPRSKKRKGWEAELFRPYESERERRYFFRQGWGPATMSVDVRFAEPVDLRAVEYRTVARIDTHRTSFIVVRDLDGRPLAVSGDSKTRTRFVTRPVGVVGGIRIELYRASGSKTFPVVGFALYGTVRQAAP